MRKVHSVPVGADERLGCVPALASSHFDLNYVHLRRQQTQSGPYMLSNAALDLRGLALHALLADEFECYTMLA